MADDSPKHKVVNVQTIEIVASVKKATVSVRSYMSSRHLWAAQHFTHLAAEYERDPIHGPSHLSAQHQTYVTTAVMEAVAFIEASVNEVFQDAADLHHHYVQDLPAEHLEKLKKYWDDTDNGRRVGLLKKYDQALEITGNEKFDHGCNPYQDASRLVELRDWLVHYRPQSVSESEPTRFETLLHGRFPDTALDIQGSVWFPNRALGKGCASWAVTTALALVDVLGERLGLAMHHRNVNWMLEPPTDFDLPRRNA